MNTFRLKSNLLTNQANRWFLQNQPYTGVIFFDKDDFQLEIFEVKNGYITQPYISPCQKTLTDILVSPISIDSSSFSNEDEDIYGCGTIPQLYQDKPYQGMSYTFRNGKCIYESYTDKDGITESKINWSYSRDNEMLDDLWRFEIENYNKSPHFFCYYYRRSDAISFSYGFSGNNGYEYIHISYCPETGFIDSLSLEGEILKTKSYLNSPINLPNVFNVIENYHNFIFRYSRGGLILKIDKNYIQELFDIWFKNNAFTKIKSMYIAGVEGLRDLSIFSNKKYFDSLSEMTIRIEEIEKSLIDDLKRKNPNIDIDIKII